MIETMGIDNAPTGMSARVKYTRESEDRYTVTFEVANPGADYKLFEEIVMERIK